MSDSRLLELRRRFWATGSLDDELAYLRERLRTGDLDRQRLELAAYCGHLASRKAIENGVAPAEEFLPFSIGIWKLRDRPLAAQAAVRMAATGVQVVRELYSAALGLASSEEDVQCRVESALHAAELWCECPCRPHETAARETLAWLVPSERAGSTALFLPRGDLRAAVCAALAAADVKADGMAEHFWARARRLGILPRPQRNRFAWASLSLTAASEFCVPELILETSLQQRAIRDAIADRLPRLLLA